MSKATPMTIAQRRLTRTQELSSTSSQILTIHASSSESETC